MARHMTAATVQVSAGTRSVTHVAANIIRCLKQIIRECGLDVSQMATIWPVLEDGTETWLRSGHLKALVLEIYNPTWPASDDLIGRFDFTIAYDYYGDGDGELWLDPDTITFAIRRAGTYPSACRYRFVADTAPGYPHVEGWSETTFRSTAGMVKQSLGTAIGGGAIGAGIDLYRRPS